MWPIWGQLESDAHRMEALERKHAYERRGDVGPAISGHELIPERSDEGEALMCMRAAKGDLLTFERLYYHTLPSEVYRMYALQLAADYFYRPTDQTEPESHWYNDDDDDIQPDPTQEKLPDFA